MPHKRELTKREYEVLHELDDEVWLTPQLIGGSDGSHHSYTLSRFVKQGLAKRKKLHGINCPYGRIYEGIRVKMCHCKGSCKYRRTQKGRLAFEAYMPPNF